MLRNPSRGRTQRRKLQSGFTLVELMIVVVIVSVLASVAIPAIQEFIVKSRESEAPTNIMAIAQGAKLHYNEERVDSKGIGLSSEFPVSTNSRLRVNNYATMPITVPCQETVGSPLYRPNSGIWYADRVREPWFDLKFSLARSHYFQYGYQARSTGRFATFTVRARGDLDCTKEMKTFMFRAHVDRVSGEIIPGEIVSVSTIPNDNEIKDDRKEEPLDGDLVLIRPRLEE